MGLPLIKKIKFRFVAEDEEDPEDWDWVLKSLPLKIIFLQSQTLILICPVQNSECQQGNVMVLTLIFWVWKYQVWSHVSHGVKFSHENIRFGWHLSHVRCHGRENIRGRGHISCPGHCRPGASKQLREGQEESDCMRLESCSQCSAVWELNRAENILGSMWTFQSWWTLILIMRGNNVTVVSEWEMNAHWRNADICLA